MIKFIKKIYFYILKKKNKNSDNLDSLVKDVINSKDPFIYK